MAFLQAISVMITSLIILQTIPSTKSVAPDQPTMILIDSVCVSTVNMYDCEQSIIPNLDKPNTDMPTIGKITAFNALLITKTTMGLIRDDFLPKADNALAKTQLQTCLATYNGVEKVLEGAYKAVIKNDFAGMRRYQANVIRLLETCKSDFDLMVHQHWRVRLMINISISAGHKLP